MSTILPFPNVHGLRAPLAALPADALEVLARYRAKCRRRLSLHPVADDVLTMPAAWHEDIFAAAAAGARMAGAYISEPIPLPEPGSIIGDDEIEAAWERGRYGNTGPRFPRRPLPGAVLDRAAEAKRIARLPLPELLLRTGAMTHERPTWRERLRAWWVDLRIRLGLPL